MSFPLTPPAALRAARVRFGLVFNNGAFRSPNTRSRQVVSRFGAVWRMEVDWAAVQDRDAQAEIESFLTELEGIVGTFSMGDPRYLGARGTALGSPLVKGAGQTGTLLLTDGWTNSQAAALKKADYFQIGSYLYRMTANAASDGSGNATLNFQPPLRGVTADDAPITVVSPKALFALDTDDVMPDMGVDRISSLSFTATEVLP